MIFIPEDAKTRYQNGQAHKNITISIPGINKSFYASNINGESLNVKESVFDSDSLEFVGCISSTFQVEVMNIEYLAVGQYIVATMTIDEELVSPNEITLFRGYIAAIENTLDIGKKKITAYDELYYKCADKDISSWYNSLTFPITIEDFRDSLFGYLDIYQVMTTLPNDSVEIEKIYDPKELNALTVIRNICQLNGVMGIINRDGKFEYRKMGKPSAPVTSSWPYPSLNVFPSGDKYPNQTQSVSDESASLISYYKKITFEGYTVNKITQVVVRDSQDDENPQHYGSGDNKYIVQNNMFIRGLPDETKALVAKNIYENICDFEYIPFKADILGQPWLECGDWVRFYVVKIVGGQQQYDIKDFVILDREFKGCQELEDSFESRGNQNQKLFISDIGTSIDLIETKVDELKDEIDSVKKEVDNHEQRIKDIEDGGAGDFKIKSQDYVPRTFDNNTLYLIQGELINIQ